MARKKAYDQRIDYTNNVDWYVGDDSTENLPLNGEAVQYFIKDNFKHKAGYFYTDLINSICYVFANEADYNIWKDDESENHQNTSDLVIGEFEVPSKYSAKLEIPAESVHMFVVKGEQAVLTFNWDIIDNMTGGTTNEGIACTYTFTAPNYQPITVSAPYNSGNKNVNYIIPTEYLRDGINYISISFIGQTHKVTASASVTIQLIDLNVEDNFDIKTVYGSSLETSATFSINAWGSGRATVEWYLDGILQQTTSGDTTELTATKHAFSKTFNIGNTLYQGIHTVQARVYITTNDSTKFYSDTLFGNIMVYQNSGNVVLFAIKSRIPVEYGILNGTDTKLYDMTQYVPYTLHYAVFSSTQQTNIPVSIYLNNELISTVSCSNNVNNTIDIVPSTQGEGFLMFKSGNYTKQIPVNIALNNLGLEEITDMLDFNFIAGGRTNQSDNKDQWSYQTINGNTVTATFENFGWNKSSGWYNNRLIINNGAKLSINYAPLAGNLFTNGKTIEFAFASRNVTNDEAVLCNLRQDDGVGIKITATEAVLSSLISDGNENSGKRVSGKYKSGEDVRISFVITPSSDRLIYIYINGVLSGAVDYDASNDPFNSTKQLVFEGTDESEIELKQIRVYNTALNRDQILNNYMLYQDSYDEMMRLFNKNDVYEPGTDTMSVEKLAATVPVMVITGDIPTINAYTSEQKGDMLFMDRIVYYDYIHDCSFVAENTAISCQGTSSMRYPKKNFRLYNQENKLIKAQGWSIDNYHFYTMTKDNINNPSEWVPAKMSGKDGKHKWNYQFRDKGEYENGIPQKVSRWCIKADFAESSGTHNTGVARIWNNLLYDTILSYTPTADNKYYILFGNVVNSAEPINMLLYERTDHYGDNVYTFTSFYYQESTYSVVSEIVGDEFILQKQNTDAPSISEYNSYSSNDKPVAIYITQTSKYGVNREYALRTNAQKAALLNYASNKLPDVRTTVDGFPIVMFYHLRENDPLIFMGKYNFNNDKSTESVFGFVDIPGFDLTDDDGTPYQMVEHTMTDEWAATIGLSNEDRNYATTMQCWELLDSGNDIALYKNTNNYDVWDSAKCVYGWGRGFEARYPDDQATDPGSTAEDNKDCHERWCKFVKPFADWMIAMRNEANIEREDAVWDEDTQTWIEGRIKKWTNGPRFASEKWEHFDIYKIAAYYIYLIRFAGVDQTVKNAMFTSEDGQHWYYINYDNDTILGVRNDGRLKYGPEIDRNSIDPELNDYCYAGRESTLWNCFEADEEFMKRIVPAVDDALYRAGLTYDGMLKMFEEEQTNKWCEKIYNQDAYAKYVESFYNNSADSWLESMQGSRLTHRRWWLSHRFDYYDSMFMNSSYKSKQVNFLAPGAPNGSAFRIYSGNKQGGYFTYSVNNRTAGSTEFLLDGEWMDCVLDMTLQIGSPVGVFNPWNIKTYDFTGLKSRGTYAMSDLKMGDAWHPTLGSKTKEILLGDHNNVLPVKNTSLVPGNFTGVGNIKTLEVLDITDFKGLTAINGLNELEFLKEFYAGGSGLLLPVFAEGVTLTTCILPETLQKLEFTGVQSLTVNNLTLEGNGKNIKTIKIINSPGLSSSFSIIDSWYSNKVTADQQCSIEMDNINWNGVTIDKLMNLANIGTKRLSGIIQLNITANNISDDQIEMIKSAFGQNVFNKENELYITGIQSARLYGPNTILEGSTAQYENIIFTTNNIDSIIYTIPNQESTVAGDILTLTNHPNVSLNMKTGLLSVLEVGDDPFTITLRSQVIFDTGRSTTASIPNLRIEPRLYPETADIEITGDSTIRGLRNEFEYHYTNDAINGLVRPVWSITGEISTYVYIVSNTDNSVVVSIRPGQEVTNIINGNLHLELYKQVDNSFVTDYDYTISVINEDILVTELSNPGAMHFLTAVLGNKLESTEYVTKSEIANIYAEDFNWQAVSDASGNTDWVRNFTSFNEFEEFNSVYYIPERMFYFCTNLRSIKLPDSIREIKDSAFTNCTNLTSITIPNGVEYIRANAFFSSGLTSVNIPSSVKELGQFAFYNCSNLSSVTLNDGLEKIGSYSFANSPNIQSLFIPSTVTNIEMPITWNSYNLRELRVSDSNPVYFSKINSIETNAILTRYTYGAEESVCVVMGIPGVTNLVEGINEIGSLAFYSNASVDSISFPSTLKYINNGAFQGISIATLDFSSTSIKFVGDNAFNDGTNGRLTHLFIPATLKYVAPGAFRFEKLQTIEIETGHPIFDDTPGLNGILVKTNFDNTDYPVCRDTISGTLAYPTNYANMLVTIGSNFDLSKASNNILTIAQDAARYKVFSTFTVPASVVTIYDNAFNNATISQLNFEENSNLTSIRTYAFYNLNSESTNIINLANCTHLNWIQSNAFQNTQSIRNLQLPDVSTLRIEDQAFSGCHNMHEIYILSTTAPDIHPSAWGTGSNTAGYNNSSNDLYIKGTNTSQYQNDTRWTDNLLNPLLGKFTITQLT